jgi:hypothetical protein
LITDRSGRKRRERRFFGFPDIRIVTALILRASLRSAEFLRMRFVRLDRLL